MIIPNYEIIEKIAESSQATIYKAYYKKNPNRLLVLKYIKTNFLSKYKKSQITQKIEHLKVLNSPMVITPILFSDKDEINFIIQDYYEGITLNKLLEIHSKISLNYFFTIAIGLNSALEKVQEAGIIHGGIKPHNILVDPSTLSIRLIDFISTLDVRDVSHFIYDHSFIKETLAYTSPEQTGRISHRVVFSSDLYSLGIVFYEMLTGRLPFLPDDPLELIHSHLAEEAPCIHELNPDIPPILSKIVAKLMLKEPEKRYQSASGLLADLVRCRDEYSTTRTICDFPLESCVYPHRATFISKMVGRGKEAQIILEEYEKAARGDFRSLFISGLSGIGKTRLIQELQKPIVKHRGYFTSGKFDVYQKNIPYSSLIQAFRNLMRTFLTESDERVAAWKDRILKAIGQNGKVLTDVIPELEILVGPQPEVKQLPPVESLNRFRDLFDRFLGCLASEKNPLTLFIDDLQWCDVASFDFLENIFANHRNHPYLFLLGAYRHNEVDSSHPLCKLILNIRRDNQPLKEIRLGPLRPEHCHEMVSYILDSPLQPTKALSDFISTLTEGNPLFVSESLSYLHNEDLLYLDSERQWCWDLEKIRQSSMPTTVVSLFSSKIQKLPPNLIELIEYCACMGNTFSPTELSLIKEMTLLEAFEVLKPSLGQGLLIESKNQLQFIHDKVQEAALFSIPAEKRRQIHWQVGNHLLYAAPEGTELEKFDNLFTIASHLNLGREDNLDSETAYLLSDINYHAGNKALNSLATEAASEYFNISRGLLPDDCWETDHYECTFRTFQKAAKTELMCGNYEDSEKLLNYLLDHAKTDLDKAECLAEQTTSMSSIGNFIKAIETANRGLAYFGKVIPEDPVEADRKRQKLMAEIASRDIDVWNTILNMPFTTDRRSKIELALYSELIPDLYMSGLVPQLYLSAAQSTQHCLSGGMDESVIYSFSIMGLQLGEREEFESAFKYEDLARDLSAKYPNTFGATRGMNGIVWCNMHSRSHPGEIVDYCLKSIQCGKNCGDLYNAGLSYGPLMWNLQVQGADLSIIEDYARECLQFSNRYHLSFSVGLADAMQAGWIEPMKKGYSPVPMEEKLNQWEQNNHIASAGSYYVHMALAHYYFGEYEEAEKYLVGVRKYLSGLTDNVLKRQWHVFRVLNSLKLYERDLDFKSEEELLTEIQPIIKKVEAWEGLGPLLKPYLAFTYAEIKRVTGEFREARNLYLDAIEAAHKQNYTFLEGHLNECLGGLLLRVGQPARIYFVEAARLYKKCGAERKENNLIERYPEYFEEERTSYPHLETESPSRTLPDLDIEYLMKSCFAISAEIEQDALLKKIMNVVIEYSGAGAGYLLIEEESNLFIRAESHTTDKETVKTINKRLEDANDICKAIVRYVHRTGEQVILNNAMQEGIFKDNPEVQEMQLRSVLCLPIVKQSKMIGVLYLENRLSDSVFTLGKTDMMELLVSQAAISLENSTLFYVRKKAEELKLISNYNRSLIEASLDPLVTIGPDGKITDVNEATELVTGYSRSELIGTDFTNYFTEPEKAKKGYQEVFREGLVFDYELEIRSKKGRVTPVLYNASIYKNEVGEVIGVFAAARDITERKKTEESLREAYEDLQVQSEELQSQSEEIQMQNEKLQAQTEEIKYAYEALRESETKFRTLAENSPDVITRFGRQNHHLYVNPAAAELYGYPQEEIIGKTHTEIGMDPKLVKLWESHCENVFTTRKTKTIEFQYTLPQGKEYYFSTRIVPEFVNGDVTSILSISRDIADIKEVEEALRLSNVYNRSLLEASLDPLVTIGPEGKIMDVNGATEQVTGYSRNELIGTYFSDYFTEPEKSRIGYEQVFTNGKIQNYPLEIQHKNGKITPVLYNASVYTDENGEVIGVFAAARDITELKKVQKELEFASNYNRSLIEASLDPLVTIGPDGKITDVNKATELVTGYSREKLIGTDFSNYFTEPEKAKEGYKQAFREGLVRDYALEIQHKEDRIIPVLYNASIYRNEDNEIVGIFAAARDITELKKAEERIQSLANVVESSNDAIITKSLDGIILSWNKGAEKIYGYSPEEILRKPVSTLAPLPLNEETLQLTELIKQGKNIHHYETSRLRKDGRIIDVSITLSPVFNLSGKLSAVSVIARDITESKKADREIKENEERFRIVTEQTGQLIYEYDIGENKIYWTGAIEKVTEYTPEELIATGMEFWVDNVHPEDRNKVWDQKIKDCNHEIHYIGDKKNFQLEYRFRRKDGNYIYIEDHGVCLQKGSYLTNKVFGVMKDITERKEAEVLLAKIEEARKKEIHHRIKNNLQVISSLLDLQAEKFASCKECDTSKVLEAFRESKNRVISMALIHEELYGSKEVSTLNFGAYLQKLTNDLFRCYNFGDLKAYMILETEDEIFFDMDTAVPLGIIVNELVSNSLKHAFPRKDKGKIQIRLYKEEDRNCENNRIGNKSTSFVLAVSDNGVGIPETINLEDPDTLGIQLVTILIDQLDGKFQLKRDSGTEFIISFSIPEKK